MNGTRNVPSLTTTTYYNLFAANLYTTSNLINVSCTYTLNLSSSTSTTMYISGFVGSTYSSSYYYYFINCTAGSNINNTARTSGTIYGS